MVQACANAPLVCFVCAVLFHFSAALSVAAEMLASLDHSRTVADCSKVGNEQHIAWGFSVMGTLVGCAIVTRVPAAALQACTIYVCSLHHPGG